MMRRRSSSPSSSVVGLEKSEVGEALDLLRRWMGRYKQLQCRKEALTLAEAEKEKELLNARCVFAFCQRACLEGLALVYPIEIFEEHATIRGLVFPKDSAFADDEQLSAGLGYVCHVTLMLAKYLLVNLRYQLKFHASRSLVCDAVLAPDGGTLVFPLFRKDVEKKRFDQALFYLQADVQQLMWARGHAYRPWLPVLAHLKTLCDMEKTRLTTLLMPPPPPAPVNNPPP